MRSGGEEHSFREMEREETIIVTATTPRKPLIAIKSEWFRKYIGENYGIIHACNIVEVASDRKSVESLGGGFVNDLEEVRYVRVQEA